MFQININDVKYKVAFSYITNSNDLLLYLPDSEKTVNRLGTMCTVTTVKVHESEHGGEYVSNEYVEGYAYLRPGERMNKNMGRKYALADALEKMGFEREEKEQFWVMYFNVRGGKYV